MHVEKGLGCGLLNRNSRTLSLTEPGRVYFERCKTVLDDLEETELELGSLNRAPRGTLRISCPGWAPDNGSQTTSPNTGAAIPRSSSMSRSKTAW